MTSATAATRILSWDRAIEILSAELPNFEVRPQQDGLARFIETILATTQVGFAQAGCGVGKSFGGVVPAVAHSLATGEIAILSTGTKALQTQYATKDLPFLQTVLAKHDVNFTWTILKGRSNYACLQKISEGPEVPNVAAIKEELDSVETHTGDFDDFVTPIDPRDRSKLAATSEECPGKKDCPFGEVCYAEQAKERAWNSNVVVVNHSLLITDLNIRAQTSQAVALLPEAGTVIVDEGHELENFTTSALGSELTQRGINSLGADVASYIEDPKVSAPLAAATQALFDRLGRLLPRNEKTAELTDNDRLDLQSPFVAVIDAVQALGEDIKGRDVYGDDKAAQKKKRLKKRVTNLVLKLLDVLTADKADLVRWLEIDNKRGVLLKYAPLHVGAFLAENLWQIPAILERDTGRVLAPARPRAAVLMSATLAVGKDFSFIAYRLGVQDYRSYDAGSPFNFAKQLRVLVPGASEMADPSKDPQVWRSQVVVALDRLVRAAGGRALLLFTSTSAMNQAHAALEDGLDALGITVLKQGDANPRELADRFSAEQTSVLFGLKSFMTGVDFQGDTLRLTVLDKLPFAVPSDVLIKARCEAIDREARNKWVDGSFPTFTVPEMALTTVQAAGRQIRTQDDEGLFAIFDSRLLTKKYGKTILKALPAGTRLETIAEGVAYLEELTARR